MKRRAPLALASILALALTFALPAQAEAFERVPAGSSKQVKVQLKKKDAKFLDQATFSGIHSSIRFMLEAHPERSTGFHTRIDNYEVGMDENKLGEALELIDAPIGFEFINGMRVLYSRQLPSASAARSARAYGLGEFPLTSKIARERLQPGDFATFTTKMHVLLTAGYSVALFGEVELGAAKHVAVSGDFLVQVYRLGGDRARVRLLAIQTKSKGGTLSVGYGVPLSVVGIESIGPIEDVEVFEIEISRERKQGVFSLLDFTYDLSNPEAAEAYDSLMSGNVRLSKVRAENPLKHKHLTEALLRDTTKSESLATADAERPASERRVERMEQARASFNSLYRSVEVSLGLLSVNSSTTTSVNKVTRTNAKGETERFLFSTFTPENYVKILFGLSKKEELNSVRTLVQTDHAFRPRKLRGLTFVSEQRVKRLHGYQLERLRQELNAAMPGSAFSGLRLVRTGENTPKNGLLRAEITFNEAAFRAFRKPDPRVLPMRLHRFLSKQDLTGLAPRYEIPRTEINAYPGGCPDTGCYERDFEEMGSLLLTVVDNAAAVSKREAALRELMGFPVFRRYGAAILMGFLPAGSRTPYVRVRAMATATGMRPYLATHGTDPDGLLESLEEVHEQIFGEPFANPFKQ